MSLKKLLVNRLFLAMVVVPMLVAIAYFMVMALDRYVSTARVVVREAGGGARVSGQLEGLANLLGNGPNPTSREETLFVREFVISQDMLNILEKKLNWSQHYSSRMNDPFYYLSPGSSQEEMLKYYHRMVTAHFDEPTGLLTIEVQAFDREFAKQVVDVILAESDRFVNDISHRMSRELTHFTEEELDRSRRNYEAKRDALLDFQNSNNLLDAQKTATAHQEVIGELYGELSKESATLKGLRATLNEDSPQVRQQKVRIQAIQQQILVEQQRLAADSGSNHLNAIASQYHNLQIEAGIAEDAYKLSISSAESNRIAISKRLRSLIVVVTANMPDEALYPKRAYDLFTTLIILLLVYGITCFVIATIQDHRD